MIKVTKRNFVEHAGYYLIYGAFIGSKYAWLVNSVTGVQCGYYSIFSTSNVIQYRFHWEIFDEDDPSHYRKQNLTFDYMIFKLSEDEFVEHILKEYI